MNMLHRIGLTDTTHLLPLLGWSALTIGVYWMSRQIYRRWPRWWTSPVLTAQGAVTALVFAMHVEYKEFYHSTGWLLTWLGPVTVAFAIPIYERRALIRRFWPVLVVGILVGSVTAMLTAWGLASLLGLSDTVRLSLLPRSVSMPFALAVSGDIGGVPSLTAIFVVCTGLLGATVGEGLLVLLPLRSTIARGALFGMGAHAAGVAKAHQIGQEEASIAGLVLVLAGLLNVLSAPLVAWLLA